MKRALLLIATLLTSLSLACNLASLAAPTSTPVVYADTFFSGRAYLDANGNRQIDAGDPPLANARFTAAGFGAITDATGHATIVIPGGWDQPVSAQMSPPENSGYTLIGPTEVILQSGGQTSADFLFAAPLAVPATPAPIPTAASLATQLPTLSPMSGSTKSLLGDELSNLTYCTTTGGVTLKMDLHLPRKLETPAPVVLYVHGGGWTSGDKDDGSGRIFIPALLEAGYLVASINYRLSPEYQFPAHIEDVRCAVRYLRANAAEYGLDPERIGAMGASAGGHLVALLGLAGDVPGWEAETYFEPYAGYSSLIRSVVDLFGPTDLTQLFQSPDGRQGRRIFGEDDQGRLPLETFSPVTYISSGAPPFLILQGAEDDLVPPSQSQFLYDQLKAVGVPATLVMVQNAGHGFQPVGGEPDPGLRELVRMVVDFFNQYLK